MSSWIAAGLLFFIPLVIFPIGSTPFEIPKVFVTEIGIFILIVAKLWQSQSFSFKHIPRSFLVSFSLLTGLTIIHLIFYISPTAVFGNIFRLQGIFLLWLFLAWSYIAKDIKIEHLAGKLSLVSSLILLISLFVFSPNSAGRAVGLLGEPNALAGTAIFFWPWLFLGQTKDRWQKWLKIFSLAFVSVVIFFSGSRSGAIALAVQLTFLLLNKFSRLTLTRITLIVVLLGLATWTLPFFDRSSVFENRAEIWRTAWVAGYRNPVVGRGFGNVEIALKESAAKLNNNLRFVYVDSSHNLFLDWWVQGGIIGIGVLLYLISQTFITFIKLNRKLYLVLFLGLLVVMSFNPGSVVTLVAFWWLIGQGQLKI